MKPIQSSDILYFKLNMIDMMHLITKLRVI